MADVWWWKVRFDDGVDGWVAERQIRNKNGQAAAPRINSSVEVIPSPNRQNASGEFVNLNPPNGATVTSQRIVLRGTVTDDVYAPWLDHLFGERHTGAVGSPESLVCR